MFKRIPEIFESSGLVLGMARIVTRTIAKSIEVLRRPIWTIALRHLGRSAIIQNKVLIEHPKRVHVGAHCKIAEGTRIVSERLECNLFLEDHVKINNDVYFDITGGVILHEGVLISEGVRIHTHSHGYDPRSAPEAMPLEIGRFAWIGSRAQILPGVRNIGEGSIIAAGSVVTKPVESHTVVAGNPATIIKRLENTLTCRTTAS